MLSEKRETACSVELTSFSLDNWGSLPKMRLPKLITWAFRLERKAGVVDGGECAGRTPRPKGHASADLHKTQTPIIADRRIVHSINTIAASSTSTF
jgi:hypothetical protein